MASALAIVVFIIWQLGIVFGAFAAGIRVGLTIAERHRRGDMDGQLP